MADISKIKINETEYDIKDKTARESIENIPNIISEYLEENNENLSGKDGVGIAKIEKTSTEELVDTYTITFTDNTTTTFTVTNGKDGKDGTGSEISEEQIATAIKEYLENNSISSGVDGFSPIISVEEIEEGYSVEITDKDKTEIIILKNGKDNVDGVEIENIFNTVTVTEKVGLNLNMGINKPTHTNSSQTWLAVSEIYEVKTGEVYTFYYPSVYSTGHGFAFYGSDDYLISTTLSTEGYTTRLVVTVPEDATQMRIVFPLTDDYETVCMLFKGDVEADEFLAYGETKTIGGSSSVVKSQWTGKKACVYGCSLTQMGGWDTLVKEHFRFSKMYNRGMGGTTLSTITNTGGWKYSDTTKYDEANNTVFGSEGEDGVVWQNGNYIDDSRIALIPSDVDLIIVDGAINDYFNNAPLGELTFASADKTQPTYDESTVVGALASLITKLQAHATNAKIVVWGMTRAKSITDAESFEGENRTKAECYFDMYNAIEDTCRKMGVYFIDTLSLVQFNANNLLEYATDGVHFNNTEKGYTDVANAIISGLEHIYPLS